MKLGGYELFIPEGTPRTIDGNPAYVEMVHRQVYTIGLANLTGWRVDVDLELDGEPIGRYRVDAHTQIRIAHPSDQDCGQFTYFAHDSSERKMLTEQLHTETHDLGLITARFIPEADYQVAAPVPSTFFGPYVKCASTEERAQLFGSELTPKCPTGYTVNLAGRNQYASGQTGLTGHYKQIFTNAEPMILDHDASVTVYLRLINNKDHVRPITSKPKYSKYPPVLR